MRRNRGGYNCRHPDCIYKGYGTPDNYAASCDYISITGKSRIAQKGGERAESCTLYIPREPGAPKTRKQQREYAPPWEPLAMSLYKAGKTDAIIAAAAGVHRETISQWRRRRGLQNNPRQYERYTTFDTAKAMQLYKDGLVDAEIGRIVGCTTQTILNWRRDNGLPSNVARFRLDWERAMKLYEQGCSDKQIAAELGCNYKTVHKWRRKNNLPRKYTQKKEGPADEDLQ